MRNLRHLGKGISISLPKDPSGHIGRECPNHNCEGYFKIVPGTGLKNATQTCHCPYCGHTANSDNFHTKEQIEYAKSVAMQQVIGAVRKDLKNMFNSRPRGGLISIEVKTASKLPPVRYYREKSLETDIECAGCTLKYSVFGVFAFCPDCRLHNSLQILETNLELIGKMIDLAGSSGNDLAERLLENALEDCVSSFDGFGREISKVNITLASDQSRASKLSFQNIDSVKNNLSSVFELNLESSLTDDEWALISKGFQKRHLISHKMGIIDDEYIRKSGDKIAVAGRKIRVSEDEVRQLVQLVSVLAKSLSTEMIKLRDANATK